MPRHIHAEVFFFKAELFALRQLGQLFKAVAGYRYILLDHSEQIQLTLNRIFKVAHRGIDNSLVHAEQCCAGLTQTVKNSALYH